MVKKRGLGKSLDALLAYTNTEAPSATEANSEPNGLAQETFAQLPVGCIQRGKYQPRREMDAQALEELANSIRVQGIIQPLVVRPVELGASSKKAVAHTEFLPNANAASSTNKYELIAGERRWRAAQLAGLTEVPVIIRHIPDEAAIAIALIENIQRENLNPIEEAIALQQLIDEFGMTHQQVAEAVGKSRATVTNLLRLLALPEEVKTMLARGQLEMGHARTLITLPVAVQLEAAQLIITRGLSVRETENLVKRLQTPTTAQQANANMPLAPDILHLQDSLAKQLQMRVAIHHHAKGKGRLVIHYRSLTELNGLMAQFES